MIPVFHGVVQKNSIGVFIPLLRIEAIERLGKYIENLGNINVDIIIRKHKAQRSNSQNSYYWGVVLPILGGYFGYENDEVHFALRNKFLKKGACDLETARSTASLSTAEFEEYLEDIRRWAITDYNVNIPLPNEVEI
jgi:hypothetical protein